MENGLKINLNNQEKDLLLQDLCARLPYGVKLQNINNSESIVKLRSIDLDDYCCEILFYTFQGTALTICNKSKLFRFGKILRYKPYLYPLSSMTEEQKRELEDMGWSFDDSVINNIVEYLGKHRQFVTQFDCFDLIDWLNKNYFDYKGLIPMGLANDATGLNIY